jgi:hypothetical protein
MKNICSTQLTHQCVFTPFKISHYQEQNALVLVSTHRVLKLKQNCFVNKNVQNLIIKFSHVGMSYNLYTLITIFFVEVNFNI